MNILPFAAVVLAGGGIIGLLVTIIVIGLLYWLCTLIPLPDPFPRIIQVVFIVAAVIVIINFLLGLTGHAFVSY